MSPTLHDLRFASILFLLFQPINSTIQTESRKQTNKEGNPMSEDFGPDFLTVTDEDGNELVLEYVDTLEHNGQTYMAFFPAVEEGADEDDADYGLIIMKTIVENGEELLSTLDSDEELEEVYELFAEQLYDDEDEE